MNMPLPRAIPSTSRLPCSELFISKLLSCCFIIIIKNNESQGVVSSHELYLRHRPVLLPEGHLSGQVYHHDICWSLSTIYSCFESYNWLLKLRISALFRERSGREPISYVWGVKCDIHPHRCAASWLRYHYEPSFKELPQCAPRALKD